MNKHKKLYTRIFFGVLAASMILIAVFSIDTYIRTINAIFYVLHSIVFVFSFGLLSAPAIPEFAGGLIQGTTSAILFPLDLQELIYQIRAFSIALINYEVMLGYFVVILRLLVNIFQFVSYLPLVLLLTFMVAKISLMTNDTDDGQETKALIRFKNFEKRILTGPTKAIKAAFEFYADKKQRWMHVITFIFLLFVTKLLPGALELASWILFTNLVKPNIFTFLSIATVIFFDLLALVLILGQGPSIIFALYLVQIIRHIDAKDFLKKMDEFNMKLAENMGVGTLIKGPPGVGKTTMATMLQIYGEKLLRTSSFNIMKKYEKMFYRYSWRKLDRWIDEGYRDRSFVNRAQIRKMIEDSFLTKEKKLLFGYDTSVYKPIHDDGGKPVKLQDAITIYAEAYSIYSTPKPLAVLNYSTRYSNILDKGHFPLWDYNILDRVSSKLFEFSSYATVANQDARRIYQMVDKKNSKEWAFMLDGQVEVMTEAAGERGNNKDYEGMSKDDYTANQKNDGYNMSVRVTRHWFTIDGICFNKLIFDAQREMAINADLRETLEDQIQIIRRNASTLYFPLWYIEDTLITPLIELWEKYYYKYQNKRNKRTLPIYLISNYLIEPLNSYYERIVNKYGYKEALYKHEAGGSDEEEGIVSNAKFYFLNKIIYTYTFATDAYRDFLDTPKLTAIKGFRDAPTFGSYRMTKEEAVSTKGYFPLNLEKYEKATKLSLSNGQEHGPKSSERN